MAVIFSDTFTDTAGTLLESHDATWVKGSPAPSSAVITASNRVRNGGNTFGYYYANVTPASAEYDIQSDHYVASALVATGICGRMETAAQTMYRLRWNVSTNNWELHKLVAGASTSLGTYADTVTAGVTRTAKLEVRDATKKAFIDGVEQISSADNAITAAGYGGIYLSALATPSDTKAIHLDNFSITDLSGGGSPVDPGNLFAREILIPKSVHVSRRRLG